MENKENRENTFRACLVPGFENCFMFSKNKKNKENRENTLGACLDPVFRNCLCSKNRENKEIENIFRAYLVPILKTVFYSEKQGE